MTGRSRYKTHGGIPHGSTNNLGGNLSFYLQWKANAAVGQWNDQSSNANHVTQGTSGDQAAIAADGALDFEYSEADHYDFGSAVEISSEEGFVIWLVCTKESVSDNMSILSLNNTNHMLEFFEGGGDGGSNLIRTRLASATTTITPGDGSRGDFAAGTKFLLTVEREAGGTGNINLYKNGVLLPQDSQATNTGDGEFIALGVRNGDRYFDGLIYDIAFTEAGAATSDHIKRINAYLCAKHGISETL